MNRFPGRQKDFRDLLPHAVFATFLVVMLPALLVFGALPMFVPEPTAPLSVGVGLGLGLLVGVAGSVFWQRQAESEAVTFGELMLWSWVRRRNAEDRLATSAHLLGIDASGRPERGAWLVREKKLDVLLDLSAALEAKDPYTHGHSRRVRRDALATAGELGLSESQIDELDKAAVLHDVGKIRLSDRILRKPGGLSDEERSLIQEHVEIGARMVALVGSAEVVAAVRHHHERWDGSGYPVGLSSTEIPLLARIISVVDSYDAMTTTRPYRSAFGREHAVRALRENAGSQFDPDVVEAFISVLAERSRVGAGLLLSLPFMTRAARLSKRSGGPSLASATAAAGIAAFVGASLIPAVTVPAGKALARPVEKVTVGDPGEREGHGSGKAGSQRHVPQGPVAKTRAPRPPAGLVTSARPAVVDPGPKEPAADKGRGAGPVEGPPAPPKPPQPPGPPDPPDPPEPPGPPEPPEPPEPPKPPKAERPGKGPRPTNGDPNPARGQDCPDHSPLCGPG